MSDDKRLRVSLVHVSNFQRIEAADFPLDSTMTVLSGKNRQGKSSILDFLRTLFEGKAGRSTVPIREGHASGGGFAVISSNGEELFRAELEIRQGKPDRLVIRDAAGAPTGKGQDWLKSLVGRGIALDPSEFDDPPGAKTKEARDKIRLDLFLKLFPIGIDLASVAEQRKELYEKRTQAKRDFDNACAKHRNLTKAAVPAEVDLVAKQAERAALNEQATAYRVDTNRVETIDKAIGTIKEQMATLRAQYEKITAERATIVAKWTAPPDATALAALDVEIAAGQKTNVERATVAATNKQYDAMLAEIGRMKALHEGLDASIERLDKEKMDALAAAKFPIPDLSVTESEVRYRGLPYEQASDAERLEVAFAVCVAEKPDLPLVLIDVGERFDEEALARVHELAERFDVQVLMARRGESPGIARVEVADGRNA